MGVEGVAGDGTARALSGNLRKKSEWAVFDGRSMNQDHAAFKGSGDQLRI